MADAIWTLLQSEIVSRDDELPTSTGVYLFSHSSQHYYIGQADNLKKRIKQQLSTRSTFYKNYLRDNTITNKGLRIEDFNLRIQIANIGRKEIEEFGMVNLGTTLNKFHKDKRTKYPIRSRNGLFNEIQSKQEEIIIGGETQLFSTKPIPWKKANIDKVPGIYYVVDKNGELIYLGESTNIYRRHHMHSNRTYISALRRHVGTEIFGFKFIGKKKFSDSNDQAITKYLNSCEIAWMAVSFARLELEEFLINKHQPLLNRKAK